MFKFRLCLRAGMNHDAVQVLQAELGKHPRFCFTFRGEPIRWQLSNSAWLKALEKAGISDFRFHDLRHTWASWHRQAGTSCDELKSLVAGSPAKWWIDTLSTQQNISRSLRPGFLACPVVRT